jgi:hypothetical protein
LLDSEKHTPEPVSQHDGVLFCIIEFELSCVPWSAFYYPGGLLLVTSSFPLCGQPFSRSPCISHMRYFAYLCRSANTYHLHNSSYRWLDCSYAAATYNSAMMPFHICENKMRNSHARTDPSLVLL